MVPMIDQKKQALRREQKAWLNSLAPQNKVEKEMALVKNLISLFIQQSFESSQTVGGYAPLKDEASWLGFLKEQNSHLIAFPASFENQSDQFSMQFYKCSFDELEENRDFGVPILTPPRNAEVVSPDILLIPGLAFSVKGKRLGRGKGYYDRYLHNYSGRRIGICFEEQLVDDVPSDDHDQLLHILVTDKNIYHCHQT